MRVSLTTDEMNMLLIAESIISKIKSIAHKGSSNQYDAHDHCLDKDHCGIRASVKLAQHQPISVTKAVTKTRSKTEARENTLFHHIDRAAMVIKNSAGNCQDLAALAYCYCRDLFPVSCKIQVVKVGAPISHEFVMVDLGTGFKSNRRQLIVDPWPIKAQALYLEHHFCCGQDIVASTSKPAKTGLSGVPFKKSRVDTASSRASISSTFPFDKIPCKRDTCYDQQKGTLGGGEIVYY